MASEDKSNRNTIEIFDFCMGLERDKTKRFSRVKRSREKLVIMFMVLLMGF